MSFSRKIPFTPSAFIKMQQDVLDLQHEEQEVLGRLKIAREMGDLSENGAYRYAKFELGRIRRELRRLQHLIAHGETVETTSSDVAGFGNTITVRAADKTVQYQLVSKYESDPQNGKLSMEGPLGQQILGKKVGDTVTVQAPAGAITYSLIAIT